ncbi:rod shape-determining protein RodA [Limosilactobacillus fermentum]|uniref:FtsW/RodA/SpoVE family cell cycle protein n=1 Tax=Limosilactobacillus fermentum TaxID=1613 RepID=UPI00019C6381|nr:FtsW/RodA/SpoVE family cell cycle protein [Limosilactobacillus fermentum]EEI22486.1 cell cycle protein, FtsW/RodA/SpoVE family [Limosilactobacillus fermentum ATCC 14931]MCH5403126.1 rod shape-determining protein RodA [Limosilactobacillus fermentum]MCT3438782.1 rod shape-determining protein RodA [Limosilactobacillus fermentum]MCT3456451.1 rod shape-determining protein RodA [Limosilactobacillus fermentum]MDC6125030.1 FtsW/RodA/SpoVE family cell cycle protein [Limosilactobacillus fermentum]
MQRAKTDNTEVESRIDWGIIFCVLLLALIGLASIYVAASHDSSGSGVVRQVVTQLAWYLVGTVMVIVIMQFDSEQLWKLAPIAYWAGIFLMFAILIFYSRSYYVSTGAKSWFAVGPFTFQPSEIMKPAYILMMGRVITTHNSQYPVHKVDSDWQLIGKMFMWLLPIFISLKFQNDFGTSLVFFAIFVGMILVSGVTWRILVPAFSILAVVGGSALAMVTSTAGRAILEKVGFQSYQFSRVDTWLHPDQDTSNQGYQLWQSIKAVGSGGVTGTGFNNSKVYVPVRESDMIFSVIGENFGFVGGILLILLYLLLIYLMIRVTFDTKNEFYAYISTGVIMMILFHVFENIGMNIGLLPLTGIPLPFISAGGSSLVGNLIGIGMIMSMRYHHRSYMFSNNQNFH